MSNIIKERELKMVKKSLFLIALTILVSTSMLAAQTEAPQPYQEGMLKTDYEWPVIPHTTYEVPVVDLCTLDIRIHVGWYIEIEGCNNTITLNQVSCGELRHSGGSFPCYADCTQIKIKANFDALLDLELAKVGSYTDVINGNNWQAYFSKNDIDGTSWDPTATSDTYEFDTSVGEEQYVWICVEAWDANVWNLPADATEKIGEVTITVRPTDDELGI